jgi:hypothetical protein
VKVALIHESEVGGDISDSAPAREPTLCFLETSMKVIRVERQPVRLLKHTRQSKAAHHRNRGQLLDAHGMIDVVVQVIANALQGAIVPGRLLSTRLRNSANGERRQAPKQQFIGGKRSW